jgi:nucleoside-diphosphate-sugar epimerase
MSASSISKQRIVFTGGSGVAGRHVISKLLEHGHDILNVDIISLDNPKVYTLKADLTDGAQAFNSLSCHFNVSEPFSGPVQMPDAVVHFAGIDFIFLFDNQTSFTRNLVLIKNISLGISKGWAKVPSAL